MDPISVGIDVSKATLAVAVHPTGEQWLSETTPAALEHLVARLQTLAPTIVVIEATGAMSARWRRSVRRRTCRSPS
jgi:transposase